MGELVLGFVFLVSWCSDDDDHDDDKTTLYVLFITYVFIVRCL
jgi:hypothetical protein